MASITFRQLFHQLTPNSPYMQCSTSRGVPHSLVFLAGKNNGTLSWLNDQYSGHMNLTFICKASPVKDGKMSADEDEDGVSLGTMKLPLNTDLPRFEILLFQWANSLCQGANLPLPVPLKVDKIPGGARLGFITIEDEGKTEVLVYIDCLVFPAVDGSGPIFRAIRNGTKKDQPAPGEPRIMRGLLLALQKSVEIARV
ncbi:unnamed protein product [Ilex paraguariensis]|uniref:DUF7148 domain-containing protein n=1 Tax=Ilex paraguariensis TaxID=185542 RepID=A0ABC8SVI8_9AQUA